VTPYEDRHGKYPGMNRRRQRRADEARLITIPREDMFRDSDHVAVRTALLRAQPTDEDQQPGRLFIVNRGVYGFGYHICPLCNHAEPALKPQAIKKKHTEPLTGKTCRNEQLIWPQDLAHSFETDVLTIRFTKPIAQAPADTRSPRQVMESFTRTLSEALRFAVTDLLQIQASEIRATFLRNNRFADAVLYDSCAGGAGYAVQLHQDISMLTVLKQAVARLTCPRSCSSACSACLCDYSNQLSWDQFDRFPVLKWFEELIDNAKPDVFVNAGAVKWTNASLNGLSERLSGTTQIFLFGISLDAIEGEDETTREWLVHTLNDGKRLSIHLARPFEVVPGRLGSGMRQTLRHLYPYVRDGRLRIGHIPDFDESEVNTLPRIFIEAVPETPAWFSERPTPPLLQDLLPEPIYQHSLSHDMATKLTEMISKTVYCSPDRIRGGIPVQQWEIPEGNARNLNDIFSVLQGAYIDQIVIRDPDCGAGDLQISRLVQLIQTVSALADDIKGMTIHCREQNFRDSGYMAPYKIKELLNSAISNNFPSIKSVIHVHNDKTGRIFHDRTLDFQAIDSDGCSVTHQYDLSGGIDFLMGNHTSTEVYRYEIV